MRNTNAAANAFGFESAFRNHPPDGFLAEIETFRHRRNAEILLTGFAFTVWIDAGVVHGT